MPLMPNYTGAPSVEPSGQGSPYLDSHSTPNAFGLQQAEAEQNLGRTIARTGEVVGNFGDQLQKDYNTAALSDMDNQFVKATSQRTAEFNQLRGKDALAALPDYNKFIDDTRTQIMSGAPNSAVARLADIRLKSLSNSYQVDAVRHQVAQTTQYNMDEADARVKIHQDQAGQDSDNLPKFVSSLEAIKSGEIEKARLRGFGPDDAMTQNNVKVATTGAWKNRWDTLVQNGKADQAMEEYSQKRPEITDVNDTIHDSIYSGQKSQAITQISRNLALGQTPTQRDREAYAMGVLTDRVGKIGAAGLVGGMSARESNMDPTRVNPRDGSDGSDSIGIAQWNASRAKALKQFAADTGADWQDFKTQVAFVDKELQDKPDLVAALKGAKTPEEAATIANRYYEVSADRPGTPEHRQREVAAARLAKADTTPPNPLSPARITDLAQTARQMVENDPRFAGDPKAADEAEQSVRQRFNLVKNDMQVARQEAVYGARDVIFAKTDADPTARADRWDELMQQPQFKAKIDYLNSQPNGAQEVAKLQGLVHRNIVNEPPTPERDATYEQLKGIANDRPQDFRQIDLNNPKIDMTRLQTSELHALQRKMNDASKANPDLAHARAVLNADNFFQKAGMPVSTTGHRNEDYEKFMGMMNSQVAMWQQRGKVPTDQEIRDFAAMALTPVKSGIFGTTRFYQQDVPPEHRIKIVQQYKDAGLPTPTEDQIKQNYNYWFYNQSTRNRPAINEELARQRGG